MYLSKEDLEIWERTQLKRNNTFVKIAEDKWCSYQYIAEKYNKINLKITRLYNNIKTNGGDKTN
jgi:hypothetical protein